ncbi:hypothetical protein [Agrobacterium tumefaciens]|uniref:hypothetical protein n=1 Tax=Agrobacterium tumefaciens TaxID=358 RepID=UPI001574756F|nr:hypothetical protein [Agrobacterium tumefaciens]NSY52060.1 hypothetical protein [Agrobacterium tumefaciens]NTC81656.1 hypothetical protein [Agrobacterium tumefaciens]NTD11237.1 hypothetical protein [Agrobacterium tumefaciens]WCK16722.1 hypothetical protein G6L41_023040 [Agrobacterium tumefaciens]
MEKEVKLPVSHFHDLGFLPHPNFPGAAEVFGRMQTAPKFVFSRDVIEWLVEHSSEYDHAVAVAIDAGRTELPYNTMLVEWQDNSDERIFWLVEGTAGNSYRLWPAFHYPRAKRSMVFGDYFPASFDMNGSAVVQRYRGSVPTPLLRSFIDSYAPTAGIALCLAMTLHVRGIVTREPTPVNPRLDAARVKRGKPPVTKDYVTVHIGYATDRHGKDHAYEEGRGHVKPHVRSGHYKNQAVGPGRKDRKRIWIKPYLVNYGPGTTIQPPPQYLVVP